MRLTAFSLCVVYPALLFAGAGLDKDTIPLKQRTLPSGPVGDRLESDLLAPKKAASSRPGSSSTVNLLAPSGKPAKNKMPQPAGPYIAGLDTFGSAQVNEMVIRQFLGKDLDVWIAKGLKSDPTSLVDEAKLKERIKAKWGLPFAEWSVIQYYEPGDMAIYITLDVVEAAEVKKRLSFLADPTAQLTDPGGLLATWHEYEEKAMELIDKGELEPQAAECPALHCPFGHKHPVLKRFEKVFVDGVRKHEKELADILRNDSRPEFRGAAAYLLAYLKDGSKVVEYLSARIRDPNEMVRNNALRVLGDIAEFHREYVIPIKPILEALYMPRVSDRSKAIYVAFHMAAYSQSARTEILKSAIPDILRMLDSRQPDHKEFSHGILRRVSGKDFPAKDIRAWTAWWEKYSADRALAKKDGE